MAIPFLIEPAPEVARLHNENLARCRGGACYAAIAAHFGTGAPNQLERRIDLREPYRRNGEKSWPGKFRKWLSGTLPSPESCASVFERSGGSVDLFRWRDSILWTLLSLRPPDLEFIHAKMAAMPMQIRRKLSASSLDDGTGRFARGDLTRSDVLALRNLRSLDALLALLCLAREAEIINDDQRHFLPAVCAYELLPYILYSHPELRFCWDRLFDCMQLIFWNRNYVVGMTFVANKKRIAENLAILDRDPSAAIQPVLGPRSPRPSIEDGEYFGS